MSAPYIKAFDRGFITFDADRSMQCYTLLREEFSEPEIVCEFKACEGKPLHIPERSEGPHSNY